MSILRKAALMKKWQRRVLRLFLNSGNEIRSHVRSRRIAKLWICRCVEQRLPWSTPIVPAVSKTKELTSKLLGLFVIYIRWKYEYRPRYNVYTIIRDKDSWPTIKRQEDVIRGANNYIAKNCKCHKKKDPRTIV